MFLTQSDLVNSFNAAHYLFLSHRLAETFPELNTSQVILQYTTPWPRQSYQHIFDVAKNYDRKWAALTRAASTIVVFFLTSLISLPAVVQDIIVQCTVVSAFGYTLLLHIRLYSIFPVLVIVPSLAILALAHFLYTSFKKQQEVEKAMIMHFLTDTPTISEKGKEVEDGLAKGEGLLKRLRFRLKQRHQINVINTNNALSQHTSSSYDEVEESNVARGLTIAEQVIHVTRRQSVQRGIHVMQRLQDISQGETIPLHETEQEKGSNNENDKDESDYHSSSSTEWEIDSQHLIYLQQQQQLHNDQDYNCYDYDNNNSQDNNISNINNHDVVVVEEVTTECSEGNEGYQGVKSEGEEVKDDDVDSIDFLFNDDDDDDDDGALHLPPHRTSHDIAEDDDISLSDLFPSDEEEEEQ